MQPVPVLKTGLGFADRARAYLELLRPANVITAAADVLAGYAIGGLSDARALAWLVPSGMSLYGGGVVLNDFFDRRLDAVERPERPIPRGCASPAGAAALGFTLLGVGIACAFQASAESGRIAVAIAGAALLYDAWSKHRLLLGPLNIGACRALDLMLGISAAPAMVGEHWRLGLLPLAYVAAITVLSAGEVHGGRRPVVGICMTVVLAVVVAVPAMSPSAWSVPFAVLLAWRVLPPLRHAFVTPDAGRLRGAVKAGVLSLVVLNAALAAGHAGGLYGVFVLALLPLARLLARGFAVT